MSLKDFAKSGNPRTLFSAFLYFDVHFMVWVLMGVLGSFIAKDLALSASQKGLLAAIPILGGSVVRIPMGLLVDSIGPRKTGILAQALVVAPLLATWLFASSYSSILAFGLLLGIAGGSFAVALPLASRWYPAKHQGIVMGIAGAGNSGTVLASLFAPRLAAHFGWHNVFGVALIPVLLTLAAYAVLAKESPHHKLAPKKLRQYFSVLKESDTLRFCFFYAITFGGFVGLASFLGIFFHDQYGLSKVAAGNMTALCVLAGSLFRPVGGYLSDRFGGITMLTGVFGAVGAAILGVAFLPPVAMAVGFFLIAITALGIGNGAVFQLVPQRFQKEIGVVTGIVGAAGGLGGFFLPTLLGIFKDVFGSYGWGLACCGLINLTGLVLLRIVQREWTVSWLMPEMPTVLEDRIGSVT